jgi:hypothetical protein
MEIILGAVVSLLTQIIKKYIQPIGVIWVNMTVLILAIIFGLAYNYIYQDQVYITQLTSIAAYAAIIYNLFIRPLEN